MEQNLMVCLAVLYYRDCRYSNGYRPMSFTNKEKFETFVKHNHGMVSEDEVLVILLGGRHMVGTLAAVRHMDWMLNAK